MQDKNMLKRLVMTMTFEEFMDMDVELQTSCLKHPAWVNRCFCKEFGLPWDIIAILGDGDVKHTRYICAPSREFLDES